MFLNRCLTFQKVLYNVFGCFKCIRFFQKGGQIEIVITGSDSLHPLSLESCGLFLWGRVGTHKFEPQRWLLGYSCSLHLNQPQEEHSSLSFLLLRLKLGMFLSYNLLISAWNFFMTKPRGAKIRETKAIFWSVFV